MIRRSPDLKSSTGATTTFIALSPPGSGRMAHTCPTGEHASERRLRGWSSAFAYVTARRLLPSPREGEPAGFAALRPASGNAPAAANHFDFSSDSDGKPTRFGAERGAGGSPSLDALAT